MNDPPPKAISRDGGATWEAPPHVEGPLATPRERARAYLQRAADLVDEPHVALVLLGEARRELRRLAKQERP